MASGAGESDKAKPFTPVNLKSSFLLHLNRHKPAVCMGVSRCLGCPASFLRDIGDGKHKLIAYAITHLDLPAGNRIFK